MEYPTPTPTSESWKAFLTAEILTFSLLGKALIEPPEAEWLHSLASEDVFSEIPLGMENPDVAKGCELLQQWSSAALNSNPEQVASTLNDDYTRLFLGPGKVLAPPWESVILSPDRLIFQEETLEVRKWYRRMGLEPEKIHQEPDDHIGLELVFLAHLAQLALRALENENEEDFSFFLQAQKDFIEEHPIQWVGQWCADVLDFGRTDFYKGISLVAKGVLEHAQTYLVETIEE